MGTIRTMSRKGDIKTVWDKENAEEVAAARLMYGELREKGFRAFTVVAKGDRGTQLDAFDPEAESIIMVPPLAGGRA